METISVFYVSNIGTLQAFVKVFFIAVCLKDLHPNYAFKLPIPSAPGFEWHYGNLSL